MLHLPHVPQTSRNRKNLLTAVLLGALAAGLAQPATARQTDAPKAPATSVEVETVASGLRNPWALQFLPDGRMLVSEKSGNLRIVDRDGRKSAPITGVPKVKARGQGGLLDVRLAPDFAQSNVVYLSFSEPRRGGNASTSVARGRLTLAENGGRLTDVKIVFRQQPAVSGGYHFGSRIVPAADGTLFITTGDRGDRPRAQKPGQTIGKVIRINPDGSIPDDNPKKNGWAPEIWSMGHRNIQGAALDPATGALWTVEHGARGGDELNRPQKGRNYGWPTISYGRHYSGFRIGEGTKKAGLEQPVYYWDPSIATSGLAVYTGDLFTGWQGNILVGGLRGAQISRLVLDGDAVIAEEVLLRDLGQRIRDVRQGPDGAVYVLTDARNGKILRLSPR